MSDKKRIKKTGKPVTADPDILPPKQRGARLDDPVLVRDLGYGRGKCAGEALRSCVLAITGYPYAGTGLDSAIAKRLGMTPQRWGGLKEQGNASSVAPLANSLGLVLVALGPSDFVVCHSSWLRPDSNWPRPEVELVSSSTTRPQAEPAPAVS